VISGFTEIYETPSTFLYELDYNNELKGTPLGYYDKQSRQAFYIPPMTGIPDDITGGVTFWPRKQKNNLLMRFYNADMILEKYNESKSAVTDPKVRSILDSLGEEDNPVLVIAKNKQ
jgi:hypothetical protein